MMHGHNQQSKILFDHFDLSPVIPLLERISTGDYAEKNGRESYCLREFFTRVRGESAIKWKKQAPGWLSRFVSAGAPSWMFAGWQLMHSQKHTVDKERGAFNGLLLPTHGKHATLLSLSLLETWTCTSTSTFHNISRALTPQTIYIIPLLLTIRWAHAQGFKFMFDVYTAGVCSNDHWPQTQSAFYGETKQSTRVYALLTSCVELLAIIYYWTMFLAHNFFKLVVRILKHIIKT